MSDRLSKIVMTYRDFYNVKNQNAYEVIRT